MCNVYAHLCVCACIGYYYVCACVCACECVCRLWYVAGNTVLGTNTRLSLPSSRNVRSLLRASISHKKPAPVLTECLCPSASTQKGISEHPVDRSRLRIPERGLSLCLSLSLLHICPPACLSLSLSLSVSLSLLPICPPAPGPSLCRQAAVESQAAVAGLGSPGRESH